nr:TSUP family transporter [Conchiformibius kuhniae]
MMTGIEFWGLDLGVMAFLIVGAAVAGFIDALCGGGGLISIPVLLTAGFSPAQAIAANKLQGAVGALASTHYYAGKGVLDKRRLWALLPPALLGGGLGTLAIQFVGNRFMSYALPVMLILMAAYFAFSKQIKDEPRTAKMGVAAFSFTVVPLIGFYDGFFGTGAGTFYLAAVTMLLGMSLTAGMAYSRVLNLASNLVSLAIFIYLGKMVWLAGILMTVGEVAGVYLGSHLVYKNGAKLVKPLVVVACVAMALKYLFWGN